MVRPIIFQKQDYSDHGNTTTTRITHNDSHSAVGKTGVEVLIVTAH